MDIWIAPTNENKICFLNTLRCMQYSAQEIESIKDEDFSTYFICSLGSRPHVIDIITIIHKDVDFNKAEEKTIVHRMENKTELKLIPYDFLKDIKLRSRREKDMWDIARLEDLRILKK